MMILAKVFLALILLVPSFSDASSTAGNGTDNPSWQENGAWFLGNREFSYCIQIGKYFGASENEVREVIKESLAEWDAYFSRKQFRPQFGGYGPISTSARLKEHCSKEVDLIFYLGMTPPVVRAAQILYPTSVAFAHLESYDMKSTWGKGFIFVTSAQLVRVDKSIFEKPFKLAAWSRWNLRALVMHELGHVFGNSHFDGTIMRPNLATFLSENGDNSVHMKILANIEYERELIRCQGSFDCQERYEHDGACPSQGVSFSTLSKLVGSEVTESPSEISYSRPASTLTEDGVLKIVVGGHETKIKVIDRVVVSEAKDATPLFKMVTPSGSYSVNSRTSLYLAEGTGGSGQKFDLLLSWNQPNAIGHYSCAGNAFSLSLLDSVMPSPIIQAKAK